LAYGKALLAQARIEFDILGTGINKTIEDQNKEDEPEPEPQQPSSHPNKKIFISDTVVAEKESSDDEEETDGSTPANPQDTVETAWYPFSVFMVTVSLGTF
jgi:hypothetical protein